MHEKLSCGVPGYGFVRFGSEQERDRAKEMHGMPIEGRIIRVGTQASKKMIITGPPPKPIEKPDTTMLVANLDDAVEDDELRSHCEAYGHIVSMKRPAGKSCAYVEYVDINAAEMAILSLQGSKLGRTNIRTSLHVTKLPALAEPTPMPSTFTELVPAAPAEVLAEASDPASMLAHWQARAAFDPQAAAWLQYYQQYAAAASTYDWNAYTQAMAAAAADPNASTVEQATASAWAAYAQQQAQVAALFTGQANAAGAAFQQQQQQYIQQQQQAAAVAAQEAERAAERMAAQQAKVQAMVQAQVGPNGVVVVADGGALVVAPVPQGPPQHHWMTHPPAFYDDVTPQQPPDVSKPLDVARLNADYLRRQAFHHRWEVNRPCDAPAIGKGRIGANGRPMNERDKGMSQIQPAKPVPVHALNARFIRDNPLPFSTPSHHAVGAQLLFPA